MPGKAQNGPTSPRREFDPDDPDYIKDLQRPAVIKEDLNEMERRKRVRQIMDSKQFREELEQLIVSEHKQGHNTDNLRTLDQLSELILPSNQPVQSSLRGGIGSHVVVPIADLRGADGAKYSKEERVLRSRFASLFRLIDLFRWSQGLSNHSSLRLSPKSEQILINPFGLLYHEITASTLLKVDFNGNLLDGGSSGYGLNDASFVLHAAIHKARPDVRCIIHLLTPVVGAVTAMKCGLLPISQEAMIVGPVSYHDFQGFINDDREAASIVHDLGPTNKVRAARAGLDNLIIPSQEVQRKTHEVASGDGGGVNKTADKNAIRWKPGELEWEAWMRVLDNAGFRTGHMFRQPILRSKPPAAQSDVEVPPAACAYGLLDEVDSVSGLAHKVAQIKRDQEKIRWLNSPNVYQKIEYEETGTTDPKKLTKWVVKSKTTDFRWVQDETSPAHGTSVKVSSTHQFVPPSSPNPKEFKDKQKAIKEYRRTENVSAGPQSKILEGVTYQEASMRMKEPDQTDAGHEKILIGAASKGIIDREYRHNAQIYKQLYQPNPFASETDQDIQKYLSEVEQKKVLTYQSESGTFDRIEDFATGGSQSPESVSLMQAARDHNQFSNASDVPTSTVTTRETTFEANSDRTKVTTNISPVKGVQPSSSGGFFHRSKSDRYYRDPKQMIENTVGIPEERGAASDDEARASAAVNKSTPEKKEKKKKKFRTPSFLKSKKDKEKK